MKRRRESGATIVEAAFAIPVLFMFIMALVDLGMWSFNDNQATNAARDGARAAILDYADADAVDKDSATFEAVLAAVEGRLDRDLSAENVDVSCVTPEGDAVDGGCAEAKLDTDRIRVEVIWDWNLITPIAGVLDAETGQARGDATMTIVGRPVWDVPPVIPDTPSSEDDEEPVVTEPEPVTDCEIRNLSITDPVQAKNNQTVVVDIHYDTNGADRCVGLAVQIKTPEPGKTVLSAVCANCEVSQNHDWQYASPGGDSSKWHPGIATVTVFNEWVSTSKTFQVTRS